MTTTPPPRFILETIEQTCSRAPGLFDLIAGKRPEDTLADAMELADTLPGYRLLQVVLPVQSEGIKGGFLFSRVDA